MRLKPAITLLTNAVVASIDMDPTMNLARRDVCRWKTRQTKSIRAKTVILVRPGVGVDAHLAELVEQQPHDWTWKFERTARRGLMDHSAGAGAEGELPHSRTLPTRTADHIVPMGLCNSLSQTRRRQRSSRTSSVATAFRAEPEQCSTLAEGFGAAYKQAVKTDRTGSVWGFWRIAGPR